jgi:hypothetical protein
MNSSAADVFFAYARKRHMIYLRRQAGLPRPWTNDQILQHYRFTCVFREQDRTTVALREKFREPMRDRPEVMLLVVALRWFNRTETWDSLLRVSSDSVEELVDSLQSRHGRSRLHAHLMDVQEPPYVTGAYIIKTPPGMDKLAGVFSCIGNFADTSHWRFLSETLLECPEKQSLRQIWQWLCKFDHMGPFMAYEVVTDLRHTNLLAAAPDIGTWANAGPGAMRGLNRLHGRPLHFARRSHDWCGEMQELLALSRFPENWPQGDSRYPPWEMREVEHTLCEFDKMARVLAGEGRPRGVYSARPS